MSFGLTFLKGKMPLGITNASWDLEELYKEFIDFRTIQLADVKFHEEVLVCHYKDGSKENSMDTI